MTRRLERDKCLPRRVFWKGYLKLSLVTCRVVMTPAVSESEGLRFHNVNRSTANRVENAYADSQTGAKVRQEDIVKGYEHGDGHFVLLEDEELDSVALESTRTIDIEHFVEADSVGWIWYDSPHYLKPADRIGEEAFAVIRDAMVATGTAGLSRLVLHRREHPVLVVPRDKGMMVWTLRQADEIRDPPRLRPQEAPAGKALTMMKTLIGERMRKWSPDLVDDPVEKRLHELIARKSKKTRNRPQPKPEPAAERGDNVIDIMDALKKSLAKDKRR